MTKLWLTLAWKELREQAPKAACLAAMMLVFTGAGVSDLAANFQTGAMLLGIAGAAFFAVGAVAGEKADNVFAFVRSLPVQRWEVAVIRILVSCLFCMAAIGATALCAHTMIILGVARGVPADLWLAALLTCGGSVSLYFWITAAAIDQPTQVRAGIVGFFVILAWFAIGSILLFSGKLRPSWPSGVIQTILCTGPWGWWGRGEIPPTSPESWTRLIVWQIIANSLLFGVSVLNYGCENTATAFPDEAPGESRPLGRPRRSPRGAIAWLQFREAAPVCLGGAILLVAWSVVLAFFLAGGGFHVVQAIDLLSTSATGIGFFWMAIVGVSTFVPELQSGLATFWRSRPIVPTRWFWSKFWLGAIVSLACIDLPAMVSIDVSHRMAWRDPAAALIGYLCVPLTHLLVYSIAVLAACLVRHVVYSGILSLSISAMIVWLPVLGKPLAAGERLASGGYLELIRFDFARRRLSEFVDAGFGISSLDDLAFLPYVLLALVVTLGSAWVAAWAVKRDIAVYQ